MPLVCWQRDNPWSRRHMTRVCRFIGTLIIVAGVGVTNAAAATIWMTGGLDGTSLAKTDSATAASVTVGPSTIPGAYSTAFDTDGDLYGILNWGSTTDNSLGVYDQST